MKDRGKVAYEIYGNIWTSEVSNHHLSDLGKHGVIGVATRLTQVRVTHIIGRWCT